MNVEEFKTACKTFENVKLEAFRVMKAYYCDVDDPYEDIINVAVKKDEVVVYYIYYDYDGHIFSYFNFPISWIALNDEELDKAIDEYKKAIKLQEEKEAKREARREKAEETAKEKAELARLKAKYEK